MSRLPLQIGPLHFIGIGGIGMSGVAEVMHNLGYKMQGSDSVGECQRQAPARLGIKISIGHAREHLGDAAVVVYSSAVKSDNPELAAARARDTRRRSSAPRCWPS
jgi:UDP-N-acetylmuramate--alanine ligase